MGSLTDSVLAIIAAVGVVVALWILFATADGLLDLGRRDR
jgi:hypothetical protein